MQYRYLVFLFLITALAVITCQYSPYAPPGYHGTVRDALLVAAALLERRRCFRMRYCFTSDIPLANFVTNRRICQEVQVVRHGSCIAAPYTS